LSGIDLAKPKARSNLLFKPFVLPIRQSLGEAGSLSKDVILNSFQDLSFLFSPSDIHKNSVKKINYEVVKNIYGTNASK